MSDKSFLSWPFFEPRHRELADDLQQWCADNLAGRYADDLDSECRALVRELGAAGFLKLCVADGDRRPDVRSLAIARETLAYHSALADFAFAMQGLGSGAISLFGTVEQKRAWLPRVAAGEAIAAFAMTEPECGSDAANMQTSAMRDGNEWVLVGEKTLISNGGIADFYLTFARTGEGEGARGLSAFIVPAECGDRRRTDRGRRPASARAIDLRQCPHPRRCHRRRAGRGLPHRNGDAEPVPGDRRRGGARFRPARAGRGAFVRARSPSRQRNARGQCGDAGKARRHGARNSMHRRCLFTARPGNRTKAAPTTAAPPPWPSSTPPNPRSR